MRTLIAISISSFLAACGSDGPTLGGDVVGEWRELPNATDDDPPAVDERQLLDFEADGTYVESEGGDMSTGTYSVDNGELTILEDGDTTTVSLPYVATSTRFVFGALLPVGSADGFVGTWTATERINGMDATVTIELAADATAHVDYDLPGTEDDQSYDGTWTSIGTDAEVTLHPDDNFTVHLRTSLVEGVLGSPYEKL